MGVFFDNLWQLRAFRADFALDGRAFLKCIANAFTIVYPKHPDGAYGEFRRGMIGKARRHDL